MRKLFAASLAAALLMGGAGGAVAQERGYTGHGKQSVGHKAHRGNDKAVHKNRAQHRRATNARHGNRHAQPKAYGRNKTYRAPRVTYRNSYPQRPAYGRQVYRGQVYRNHYGWQPVPPRYSHRYRARPGYRYYRVGNDVVLVALATGLIVNVLTNALH